MTDPVAKLMQSRPVPVDWLKIGVRPRHLDEIMERAIEGAIAADAEVGAGRGNQRLGPRQNQTLGHRRRRADQPLGKILALIGVEDRESLEERDRTWLVAVALRPLMFVIGDKTIRIDDGGAALAF